MAVDLHRRPGLYAGMRHLAFRTCALLALALTAFAGMASAATAMNGAPIDPQNVIADDIQAEALSAYRRHAANQAFKGSEIVIVDYRKPSSALRLYILDLATGAVEAHFVAHGRGSDPGHTKVAMRFSDAPTTGMSSVGSFRGLERYRSAENGPALRLAGLDATNVNAYDRLIVFHTAGYFDPASGRLGRSCGCFVVTPAAMERVYGVIAQGGFLYAGPARLHDPTASSAQDCSPQCGGNCRTPLIASARPARPRTTAIARAATADAHVKAAPAPRGKPRIQDPVPVAVAAIAVPTPLAKPDLPRDPPPEQSVALAAPLPLAKPAMPNENAPAAEVAAVLDAPLPLSKPDFRPALDEAAPAAAVVPDPQPGETPVPAHKPTALRQMAQLTP